MNQKLVSALFFFGLALNAQAGAKLPSESAYCRIDVAASKALAKEQGVDVSQLKQFTLHVYNDESAGALLVGGDLISFPNNWDGIRVEKLKQDEKALHAEIEYTTHDVETFTVDVDVAAGKAVVNDVLIPDCAYTPEKSVAVYKCTRW